MAGLVVPPLVRRCLTTAALSPGMARGARMARCAR